MIGIEDETVEKRRDKKKEILERGEVYIGRERLRLPWLEI